MCNDKLSLIPISFHIPNSGIENNTQKFYNHYEPFLDAIKNKTT